MTCLVISSKPQFGCKPPPSSLTHTHSHTHTHTNTRAPSSLVVPQAIVFLFFTSQSGVLGSAPGLWPHLTERLSDLHTCKLATCMAWMSQRVGAVPPRRKKRISPLCPPRTPTPSLPWAFLKPARPPSWKGGKQSQENKGIHPSGTPHDQRTNKESHLYEKPTVFVFRSGLVWVGSVCVNTRWIALDHLGYIAIDSVFIELWIPLNADYVYCVSGWLLSFSAVFIVCCAELNTTSMY